METYENKYKELDGKIKKAYLYAQTDSTKAVLEEILPELAESKDEKIRKELIEHIKANKWADYVLFQKFSPDDVIAWLESLRPQKQWKPSDAQTKVCKEVYADILSAKGFDLGTINSELNRLEEQLKKLKE